ncbi:hypothetical protein LCGC14_0533390 [marine sediment metagenome]|uniref:Peptidase S1 domain-containing protein n=1 Tax=marine sediment metagenome TaxID=412755 RepID=A0A0F9RZP2_9ZZZZ
MGCCVALQGSNYPNAQLIDHLNRSTVQLVEESDEYFTYCSAFWISEYYLATARHCVDNDDDGKLNSIVTFTTYDEFDNAWPESEPKNVYSAILVASRKLTDIAILKSIDDVDHHMLQIRETSVPVGTEVHIVSHPKSMEYSYMKGLVSQIREFDVPDNNTVLKTLHITSLINKGSSGCAATDSNGEVVGISSFSWKNIPGMSFWIHKDELIKILDEENIKYY